MNKDDYIAPTYPYGKPTIEYIPNKYGPSYQKVVAAKPSILKNNIIVIYFKKAYKYSKRVLSNLYKVTFKRKEIIMYDKHSKQYILKDDSFMIEVLKAEDSLNYNHVGKFNTLIRE